MKPPKLSEYHVPNIYTGGGPLYWMREQTGLMRTVIGKFLVEDAELTADDIRIVREYILHWVDAPCWSIPEESTRKTLGLIRKRIASADTRATLLDGLHALLSYGIDPL